MEMLYECSVDASKINKQLEYDGVYVCMAQTKPQRAQPRTKKNTISMKRESCSGNKKKQKNERNLDTGISNNNNKPSALYKCKLWAISTQLILYFFCLTLLPAVYGKL